MFGTCIWDELLPSHPFQIVIKTISTKCNSQLFNPHITLEYNSKEPLKNATKYSPEEYHKVGNIYKDNFHNFYSLQQDYINTKTKKRCHISVGYKAGLEFTQDELSFANTLDIPAVIYKKDIFVSVWNCDSIYTSKWYKIQ